MNNNHKTMVCVTNQKTCERLIKIVKSIATEHQGELIIIHVAKTGKKFLNNPDEGKALDYLFHISKEVGADMSVVKDDNISRTLINFAKENQISIIVICESPYINVQNSISQELERSLSDFEILIIPA